MIITSDHHIFIQTHLWFPTSCSKVITTVIQPVHIYFSKQLPGKNPVAALHLQISKKEDIKSNGTQG